MRKRRSWISFTMVASVLFLIALVLWMWINDSSMDFLSSFQAKHKTSSGSGIKIGLIMNSLLEDRWQREKDIFVSSARSLGAEVFVQAGLNDGKRQISQIRYLISKDVDVLVIIPNNNTQLSPAIDEAKQKGIKVICYDSYVKGADMDFYIGFDNETAGRLQAENLVKISGKGEYIVLNGPTDDTSSQAVNREVKKTLAPFVDRGAVKIVYEEWIQDYDPSLAVRFASNSLIQYKSINGIIAPNDACAGEIVKLLSSRGLEKKINVIGANADLLACKRILSGTQTGTVYKPVDEMAKAAAEWAVRFARSAKTKSDVYELLNVKTKINNDRKDIPAVIFPVKYIDKSNAADVLKDINN